jgi:hypothetical protein
MNHAAAEIADLGSRLGPGLLYPTWNDREPAKVVKMRMAEYPDMVALPVRSLFPWMPAPIWARNEALGPTSTDGVRDRARAAVAAMDWSRIRPQSRVNILANPHGFFTAGEAYAVMLEEVQRHVRDQLKCKTRLCVAESMGHIENIDYAKIYDLPARFDRYEEVPQSGPAVEVDTRIGKFWMMHRLFNADHFVHTHVTEPRESYIHRMLDRLYKPFGMSYARLETRSAYHFGFGPRSGQLLSRLVFESEFIQQRYGGTVVLDCSPEGALDVIAEKDLREADRITSARVLRNFGTLIRLLSEIDECIVVFDGHYSLPYAYSGGLTFSCLECADSDFFDLDNLNLFSRAIPADQVKPGMLMGQSNAIKSVVINYQAGGLPMTMLHRPHPPYIVGEDVYKWLINDPCNTYMAEFARPVPDLMTAMQLARAEGGTDKIIAFDNTPGAFRVSKPLADLLIARAPAVDADVLNNRLPKWLAQRNLA